MKHSGLFRGCLSSTHVRATNTSFIQSLRDQKAVELQKFLLDTKLAALEDIHEEESLLNSLWFLAIIFYFPLKNFQRDCTETLLIESRWWRWCEGSLPIWSRGVWEALSGGHFLQWKDLGNFAKVPEGWLEILLTECFQQNKGADYWVRAESTRRWRFGFSKGIPRNLCKLSYYLICTRAPWCPCQEGACWMTASCSPLLLSLAHS